MNDLIWEGDVHGLFQYENTWDNLASAPAEIWNWDLLNKNVESTIFLIVDGQR